MCMEKIKKLLMTSMALVAMAAPLFTSCSDDPGVENYYTTKKQYAADYLRDNQEFSEFIEILNRATGEKGTYRLMDLLSTYGSYTVFAPTNDAVDKFLAQKGVSSVAELSKEDCDTIALNHIIEQEFYTSDYNNATYPQANMLDRYLTITSDSDTVSVPGQVRLAMYLNKTARIIHPDDSVMNGVVHTLNSLIGTNNDLLADLMSKDSNISLFNQAIVATNFADKLQQYMDIDYERAKGPTFEQDSVDWTNNELCLSTAVEYDNVAYMKHRYFKYTAFVETDEVFEKNGVTTLDDLRNLAYQKYYPVYPDDANITDETDPRNYLNRFVAYHFLPFQQTYWQLTCFDGSDKTELANHFLRNKQDIADWYEAMMPHSLMKFSYPAGGARGLYINNRGIKCRPDERGVYIRGVKVTPPHEMPDNMSLNGIYYYIDDVLAYDKNTQNNVIGGERLRMDGSTLSPDFLTSGARGHYTRSNIEHGKFGLGGQTKNAASNTNTCLGFKAGFAKNFYYSDNITHLHVRNRVLHFASFEGDELTIIGQFDITIKMPPVPEGMWEVRIFSCFGFENRGIIQFYFGPGEVVNGKVEGDLKPCGIPLDMRPGGEDPKIGWVNDANLGDEDAIAAFDKQFRNNGWMKGMGGYGSGPESGGGPYTYFRDISGTLRKIITRFHSDGKSDYFLRCQQKLESSKNTMNFDALELCPATVYNNEYYPENRW